MSTEGTTKADNFTKADKEDDDWDTMYQLLVMVKLDQQGRPTIPENDPNVPF